MAIFVASQYQTISNLQESNQTTHGPVDNQKTYKRHAVSVCGYQFSLSFTPPLSVFAVGIKPNWPHAIKIYFLIAAIRLETISQPTFVWCSTTASYTTRMSHQLAKPAIRYATTSKAIGSFQPTNNHDIIHTTLKRENWLTTAPSHPNTCAIFRSCRNVCWVHVMRCRHLLITCNKKKSI